MDYLQLLNRLHVALQPAVYLEIGVQHGGESLSLSRSRSVAIDPAPQLRSEALVGKQWVKLYQQPSDDFFQTHTAAATLEGELLDLAFIAGSHEFVQVVRDLENVEQWSHPGTVAVIHDVLPRGAWEATRDFTLARGPGTCGRLFRSWPNTGLISPATWSTVSRPACS
jgi:predicted O-methyltransferase YrrM